jgi:hypothetical protein
MKLNEKVTAIVENGLNKVSQSALESAIIMLVKAEVQALRDQLEDKQHRR